MWLVLTRARLGPTASGAAHRQGPVHISEIAWIHWSQRAAPYLSAVTAGLASRVIPLPADDVLVGSGTQTSEND